MSSVKITTNLSIKRLGYNNDVFNVYYVLYRPAPHVHKKTHILEYQHTVLWQNENVT